MKHKDKIGYILQQNGVVLSKRNNTRNKVVPLFVEDEYVLYQRKRIFKPRRYQEMEPTKRTYDSRF